MTKKKKRKKLTRVQAASRAGKSRSRIKAKASRENGKLGGRPAQYKCPCGAHGRQISRWKYAGRTHTKCKLCGRKAKRPLNTKFVNKRTKKRTTKK